MANLTFYGATEGVTGSSYILEVGDKTILLDCGLFQGNREEEKANKKPFQFDVKNIDAVVLSHAHLDHSGRLPKLVADGYSGPLYMTNPTCELLENGKINVGDVPVKKKLNRCTRWKMLKQHWGCVKV